MTLSRHDWAIINRGGDDVTYEQLCHAILFMRGAIDTLEILQDDVGVYRLTISHLSTRLNRLTKLKADRIPDRPELPSIVSVTFSNGYVTFHGPQGGVLGTAGHNEQTEQLRKQLEAVYETTTMVKR